MESNEVTTAELAEARGWIADVWGAKLAKRLTDAQVIAGITRHYEGGWAGFRADSA